MRTGRADSPRFNRLRERRQARESWSDLEHDDDGWLGKLKPEFAADDELGPDNRPPNPQEARPSVTKPAISDDPLRRSSPLRSSLASPVRSSTRNLSTDGPEPDFDGSSFAQRRARERFADPDDAAKHVAETVERASAAIDAARSELDQANAWAQKTKALQLSEEQIGHLLLGARRTADATVAEAQQRADQLMRDAEARAGDIVSAAEAAAATIVAAAREASDQARSVVREEARFPAETAATRDVEATLNAFAESNARLSGEISSLIRALDDPGTPGDAAVRGS